MSYSFDATAWQKNLSDILGGMSKKEEE